MTQKGKSGLKKWGTAFLILSALQFGTMYGLDRFLKPPSLEAAVKKSAVPAVATPVEAQVSAPPSAVLSALTEDRKHVAYTAEDGRLQIEDKTGLVFDEEVGDVTFMKWLEPSDTLLYFVKGKSTLTGYLIRADAASNVEPVEVHEWSAKKREVEAVYFSPYLEFFYIEMKNDSYDEIYKYKASTGIHRLPLEPIVIDHIDYNPTTDVMVITTNKGKIWKYENDRLRRPDGSRVADTEPENTERTDQKKKSSSDAADEPKKSREKQAESEKEKDTKLSESKKKEDTTQREPEKEPASKQDKPKTEDQQLEEPPTDGAGYSSAEPNDTRSEAQ